MYREELFKRDGNKHHINRYINFIEAILKEDLCEYDARHHILPKGKGCWPEFSNLRRHRWNCVKMTNRQHFIAHMMLYKAFPHIKSIVYSANMMKSLHGSGSASKLYAELRENIADLISENNTGIRRTPEEKARISNNMKDTLVVYLKNDPEKNRFRVHKDDMTDDMVYYRTGTTHTEKTKHKMSMDRRNRVWVTDGKEQKFVKEDKIPKGFSRGYIIEGDKSYLKELIWCENEETGEKRRLHEKDIKYPWVRGRSCLKENNPGFDIANSMHNVTDLANNRCIKVFEVDKTIHGPGSSRSTNDTVIYVVDNNIFTNKKAFYSYLWGKGIYIDDHRVIIKKPHFNNSKEKFEFRKKYEGKYLSDVIYFEAIPLKDFKLDKHNEKEIRWDE